MKKTLVLLALVSLSLGAFVPKAYAQFDLPEFPEVDLCQIIACPTIILPSLVPSIAPSDDPTPTPCFIQNGEFPEPCPTSTPTDVPTVTPTPTTPPSPHGDGLSDGRESGHVNAPSVPSAPPATGRG
jgi:hypothetical protein